MVRGLVGRSWRWWPWALAAHAMRANLRLRDAEIRRGTSRPTRRTRGKVTCWAQTEWVLGEWWARQTNVQKGHQLATGLVCSDPVWEGQPGRKGWRRSRRARQSDDQMLPLPTCRVRDSNLKFRKPSFYITETVGCDPVQIYRGLSADSVRDCRVRAFRCFSQ